MLGKPQKAEGNVPNPSTGIVGQRERNKRDKLLRIKNAARDLFVSKGYDDTTTREIALKAGVGEGTIFTYADNKRDLLFLIANEDLAEATKVAESDVSQDVSLLSNLLTIFRDHYEYFSRQPELSRLMLREMLFYDSGEQANRFKATREHFMSLISACVGWAQERDEIDSSEDASHIGWVIFCLYQVEIRRWLSEKKLNLSSGMAQLERAINLVLTGVNYEADSGARASARRKVPPKGTAKKRAAKPR